MFETHFSTEERERFQIENSDDVERITERKTLEIEILINTESLVRKFKSEQEILSCSRLCREKYSVIIYDHIVHDHLRD